MLKKIVEILLVSVGLVLVGTLVFRLHCELAEKEARHSKIMVAEYPLEDGYSGSYDEWRLLPSGVAYEQPDGSFVFRPYPGGPIESFEALEDIYKCLDEGTWIN